MDEEHRTRLEFALLFAAWLVILWQAIGFVWRTLSTWH